MNTSLIRLVVGLVLAVGGMAWAGGPVNVPDHEGGLRDILVDPYPAQFGYARVATKAHPATPPYVLHSTRYITRTPPRSKRFPRPGATWYGAPASLDNLHAYVRIGSTVHAFHPFHRIPIEAPHEYHVAQRMWLLEHGYINRSRVWYGSEAASLGAGSARVQSAPRSVQPAADENDLIVWSPEPGHVVISSPECFAAHIEGGL